MNADHAEAVALYAQAFCKERPGDWRLTGLDPEGLDLMLGDRMARLWFDAPMKTAAEMRPLLVRLAGLARETLGTV
jgi:putative heme iron utilization protein